MRHRTELMKDFEEDLLPVLNDEQAVAIGPYLDRNTRMPDSARRDSTSNTAADSSSQSGTATQSAPSSDS